MLQKGEQPRGCELSAGFWPRAGCVVKNWGAMGLFGGLLRPPPIELILAAGVRLHCCNHLPFSRKRCQTAAYLFGELAPNPELTFAPSLAGNRVTKYSSHSGILLMDKSSATAVVAKADNVGRQRASHLPFNQKLR